MKPKKYNNDKCRNIELLHRSTEQRMHKNEEISGKKTCSSIAYLKKQNGNILEKEKKSRQMGRVHKRTFRRPQK